MLPEHGTIAMADFEKLSGKNFPAAIQLSCVAIIAAFLGLGLFILFLAGGIADKVRLDAENKLVANELDRQVQLLARDQSQVSHWDNTVFALSERIDEAFVREEIAGWLWEDFDIETSIVVSADSKPLVVVERDRVLDPSEGVVFAASVEDLVSEARQNYMEQRREAGGRFVGPDKPLSKGNEMFAADIRQVDGQMGLVMAQAIIPDDEASLPDGAPQVLITFKPVTEELLQTMGETLGLADFQILHAADVHPDLASMPATPGAAVALGDAAHPVHAAWTSARPSATIWRLSAIPMLVLLALVAGALMFVARRSAASLSALEASERQNRFLALHDALSGLPNRVQFDQALEDVISAGRYDRCAILCIDLDRFKTVNDTYGHQAGDTVIRTVANRIAETVGDAGIAARIGGDEFIVLLHNEIDKDSVSWRCDQLIESVCRPILFEGGTAAVGASIGVAWWPDDALTAKTVIRSADEALYIAKELGRGRAYFAGMPVTAVDKATKPVCDRAPRAVNG
jgi:diguanylate cyclase (GGDEF)-like protein